MRCGSITIVVVRRQRVNALQSQLCCSQLYTQPPCCQISFLLLGSDIRFIGETPYVLVCSATYVIYIYIKFQTLCNRYWVSSGGKAVGAWR